MTGSSGMEENGQMIGNGGPRRPNVSRIYNYLLGGKDNYEDDRSFAETCWPWCPTRRQRHGRTGTSWPAPSGSCP